MIKDEDVEEEDPVPLGTPRRLTMKVVIHQVAYSPNSTNHRAPGPTAVAGGTRAGPEHYQPMN